MSHQGLRVLLIGGPGAAAVPLLKEGADLIEYVPLDDQGRSQRETIAQWIKAHPGSGARFQIRGGLATALADEGEWDRIYVNGVHEQDLAAVVSRAQAALAEGGMIQGRTLLRSSEILESPPQPVPLKVDANRNVMLHVHNVRRCGGTGNYVYDMARCFPEYQHVALCVNDPSGDARWINDVSGVMRTMYAPQVTKEILDEIDPGVLVLHATVGKRLEGDWPYNWLSDGGRRYVIAVHHIPTYPLLPADLDVFVSEYIKRKYESFLDRMRAHAVIPPCTDMAPYKAINRLYRSPMAPFKATTGGKACAEFHEAVKQLPYWEFDSKPPGRVGQFAGYLQKFPFAVIWSGHQETWCRTVSEAMAAGCLVIAHEAGAIPEQIRHGKTGYLFQNGDSLVALIREVVEQLPEDRLAEIARAGREWAVQHVGFERLREGYYPYLMRAALGSA